MTWNSLLPLSPARERGWGEGKFPSPCPLPEGDGDSALAAFLVTGLAPCDRASGTFQTPSKEPRKPGSQEARKPGDLAVSCLPSSYFPRTVWFLRRNRSVCNVQATRGNEPQRARRTQRSLTAATKGRHSPGGSRAAWARAVACSCAVRGGRIACRAPHTLTQAAHAVRDTLVATATAHGHAGPLSRGAFGNLRGLRRNATSVVQRSLTAATEPRRSPSLSPQRRRGRRGAEGQATLLLQGWACVVRGAARGRLRSLIRTLPFSSVSAPSAPLWWRSRSLATTKSSRPAKKPHPSSTELGPEAEGYGSGNPSLPSLCSLCPLW
jgi:hypothetical protein